MRIPSSGRLHMLLELSLIGLATISIFTGCGDDDRGIPPDDNGRNVPPVIDSLTVSVPVVAPADTVDVHCFARDADGDSLQYAWQAGDGTISGTGPEVKWIAATGDRTHPIAVTVTDGRGGSKSDTAAVDVLGGTLLLQTRDGVTAVDASARSFMLNPSTASIEVLGTQIYLKGGRSIREIDHQGQLLRDIEISSPIVSGHDFVMLPGGGFIFAANGSDSVHFMNASGTYLGSVGMPNPSPNLQNIDGVVVDDRVIVSDNGNNDLLAFDIGTHAGSIFRSFPNWGGWLGAIDYADGLFYLCGSRSIRAFTEAGEPRDVATLPQDNITGIVVVGSYAYVVVNFEGALHRVDVRTGEDEILLTGLNYPQDIEYLSVALTPPGRR